MFFFTASKILVFLINRTIDIFQKAAQFYVYFSKGSSILCLFFKKQLNFMFIFQKKQLNILLHRVFFN